MATSAPSPHPAPSGRTVRWLLLTLAVSLAAVAFPVWVIRPFRYQGSHEFRFALVVLRWSPWITLLCTVIVALLFTPLWRRARARKLAWLRRTGLVIATLLVVFAAVASRINIFEKMFHPISAVNFIPVAQAKLANDDMVMSVTLAGESHAYPIREMAYHHVVNDFVAGTPVIATY